MKKLLIDAISTSSGGAISHLNIILRNFENQNFFSHVNVHLPYKTMLQMPKNKKIHYTYNRIFERYLILRIIWQILYLNVFIRFKKFNCIFVTGSSHFLIASNVVTISQNLLPFTQIETDRYFFSLFYVKLLLLKFTQKISFKLSKGVIFLHKYSKKKILEHLPNFNSHITIIAHSVHLNFKKIKYQNFKKFRIIYVSNIDFYKNQIFIIDAINDLFSLKPKLKEKIIVEFYGNSYPKALQQMKYKIDSVKNSNQNFKYFGLVKKDKIYKNKKGYNTISLFASSCENFSVSLIESIVAGLPILCVNLQPMKSVLGSAGFFYNHNSKKSFQRQLLNLMLNRKEIKKKIYTSRSHIKKYLPEDIAFKTYKFLYKMSI
jgi:glycosyltransferase involved in cell wall biosynthesis